MRLAIVFLLGVAGLSCRAPEARDSMQDGSVRPASSDSGAGTFDLQDVLNEQADAWNRGDIEGFMDYYWRSEDLEFISGDTILRGWQATLERYKRKYPTKEAMGWLDCDDLRVTATGQDGAEVTGRWRVRAGRKISSGGFELKFRRIDRRWLIVRDHTTSDDPKDASDP